MTTTAAAPVFTDTPETALDSARGTLSDIVADLAERQRQRTDCLALQASIEREIAVCAAAGDDAGIEAAHGILTMTKSKVDRLASHVVPALEAQRQRQEAEVAARTHALNEHRLVLAARTLRQEATAVDAAITELRAAAAAFEAAQSAARTAARLVEGQRGINGQRLASPSIVEWLTAQVTPGIASNLAGVPISDLIEESLSLFASVPPSEILT